MTFDEFNTILLLIYSASTGNVEHRVLVWEEERTLDCLLGLTTLYQLLRLYSESMFVKLKCNLLMIHLRTLSVAQNDELAGMWEGVVVVFL